jgi:hypothetical protein
MATDDRLAFILQPYATAPRLRQAAPDAKIRARFTSVGAVVHGSSPAEFAKFIADDTEKWAKVIRLAGIKAEWRSIRMQAAWVRLVRYGSRAMTTPSTPDSHRSGQGRRR